MNETSPEVHNDNDSSKNEVLGTVKATTLPSISELLSIAFEYLKKRSDLGILLSLPFLLEVLINFYIDKTSFDSALTVSLIALTAFVSYVLIYILILYIVSHSEDKDISIKDGLAWTRKNFLGLVWVYVLSSLVILGGFSLFVIPGIIFMISLYLVNYVYIIERKSGISALLRSRDLVRGNWWAVFGRVFGSLIVLTFIVFLIGLLVSLISELLFNEQAFNLFNALGLQVVSAFVSLMTLKIGATIYHNLKQNEPINSSEKPKSGVWKFKLMAVVGFILPLILLSILFKFSSIIDYKEGEKYCGDKPLDTLFNDESCHESGLESIDAKNRAVELRKES